MACDRALLAAVGAGEAPPTLRFYAWDPPAVSLGRHQPDPEPAAAAALSAHGLAWVRRPTGGRAVYHGPATEELTYSIVAPLGPGSFPDSPAEAYRRIHAALAEGLRSLGIPASLAPDRPRANGRRPAAVRPSSRLACFAASVPYEILAGGKKLVGSAQRCLGRAFLQHGSLPVAGDPWPPVLGEIWPGSLDRASVTTASAAAARPLAADEIMAALEHAIAAALNVSLAPGVLTSKERKEIAARIAAPRIAARRIAGSFES